MLVRAALVPDTALLVPGAAGAADPVPAFADAARRAVAHLVAARPDTVVVVATAPRRQVDSDRRGPLRPTLAGAGIPDSAWAADAPPAVGARVGLVRDVAAATGLVLLAQAGWAGPVRLLELRPDGDPAGRRALGAALVAEGRVALLVLGSLSARRGPDAPVPELDDASAFDGDALADLARWDERARERLAAVPVTDAHRLAVSAWTGWQILLGATPPVGQGLAPEVVVSGVPLGATYAVVLWSSPS